MATWNKKLHSLNEDGIKLVSEHYLKGWYNLEKDYGFRLRGLNSVRIRMGLEPLDKQMSEEYRLNYIRNHYTNDEILKTVSNYLRNNRVGDARWTGIELFGCRFTKDYAKLFRLLIGREKYDELSESLRRDKSIETQMDLYGGVGLAGQETKEKAQRTVLARYGVTNVMYAPSVQQKLGETNLAKYGSISPFGSDEIQNLVKDMKCKTIADAMRIYKQTGYLDEQMFKQSPQELVVLHTLISRFGVNDVYYQYGIHPSDKRYPYNCDFYIKSLDLFIELNGHYTHGNHWFDAINHDDVLRMQHLLDSGKVKNQEAVRIWTKLDLEKREAARKAKLNYLVFWDGGYVKQTKPHVPRLSDFYKWFYDYNCDYNSFVQDFPYNTY